MQRAVRIKCRDGRGQVHVSSVSFESVMALLYMYAYLHLKVLGLDLAIYASEATEALEVVWILKGDCTSDVS